MSTTRKTIALAGVLLIAGAVATAEAAKKKVSRGGQEAEEASELMQMFDADKNGTVSKDEFLSRMGQMFDRLDTNKNQQLEPRELNRLPYAMSGQCLKASPPPRCLQ